MLVFLVSIRTALIFGPGRVQSLSESGTNQVSMSLDWPYEQNLDEWEGYAVVVPEQDQVWGLCHPQFEGNVLQAEFDFTPQRIPPQDARLFIPLMKAAGQLAIEEGEDEEES